MARRRKALAAVNVKELLAKRVQVGPVNVPVPALVLAGVALAGIGVTLLVRMSRARNTESDGTDEAERPTTGPCAGIEDQLSTPVGCGTVKVTGYSKTGWQKAQANDITLRELAPYPGFYLQVAPTNAHAAFLRMRSASKSEAGLDMVVNSAFRTMGKQRQLYEKYLKGKGALAAYPGTSPHQMGVAVDIQTGGGTLPIYQWLVDNCTRFGFHRTVPSETWHYHYKPETDPFLAGK